MTLTCRYGLFALFVVVLVACAAPSLAPARAITFMVSGDAAEKAAYERLVAAFRERHPTIQVTLIHIPGQSDYRKRLGIDFAAGTPADIVLINYRRYAPSPPEASSSRWVRTWRRVQLSAQMTFMPKQ
jgi:multiple sugar transport system substrate-binding protein